MNVRAFFLSLLLFGMSQTPFSIMHAQFYMIPRPHDDWRTIETEHFKVHFPSDLQAWSSFTSERMESIHEAVTAAIGYNEIDGPMDVIIMDPLGLTNGMAVPLLATPRIVLWPNAPVDPMMLGGLETWSEIVFVHEYVHAVHLTRNPRSLSGKLWRALYPLGPLTLNLPIWATEGYAVLLESDLTGYGRVNSSLRAMMLSQLAVEGYLPTFSELDGSDRWLGGRYPYLVGSAYLQWLKERSGQPDCLLNLWKRLSAREQRSFEDAFSGVFKESPEKLYRRFSAELTSEALQLERLYTRQDGIAEGVLWQYIEGMTGEPAVTPDGQSITLILRPPEKPPELVIWSTHELAEGKPDPALNDPEDVAALPVHPPKYKELHSFPVTNGISPAGQRWASDGQSLYFHSLRRRPNGDMRSDLYRWYPKTDRLDRLTEGSGLGWADPSSDNQFVVAIKRLNGFSNLVRLDLDTGAVRNITDPSIHTVWQSPRLSPDQHKVAAVRRENNRSELVIIHLDTGNRSVVSSKDREVIIQPCWLPDGTGLIFCSDRSGCMNLEKLSYPGLERTMLTFSMTGLLAPEPARNSSGGLYCLKPHSEGLSIHYLASSDTAIHSSPIPDAESGSDYPFVRPPENTPDPAVFVTSESIKATDYRAIDNLESDWITGLTQLPYNSTYQVGIRSGDILGRISGMIVGSIGQDGGAAGGRIGLAYRGLPVHLSMTVFHVKEAPADQRLLHGNEVIVPDIAADGVDLTAAWRRYGSVWKLSATGGGVWASCEPAGGDRFVRFLGGLSASASILGNRDQFSYGLDGKIAGRIGQSDDSSWTQYNWDVEGYLTWKFMGLRLRAAGGETVGDAGVMDMFSLGGINNSVQSEWFWANRLDVAWLPAAIQSGEMFSKKDIELCFGSNAPFVLYGTEVGTWSNDIRDPQRAIGCEWRMGIPNIPLFRIGASTITAGAAYGLNGIIEDKWRGYLAVIAHF
ncbi:hypothetical protein JW823_03145 [bacterium]|nr:hypothetical protein [candidate division CSSED10-310 bacterium]